MTNNNTITCGLAQVAANVQKHMNKSAGERELRWWYQVRQLRRVYLTEDEIQLLKQLAVAKKGGWPDGSSL